VTDRELPPGWTWARLGDLGIDWRERVDPQSGAMYELWSVPAFSNDAPEICDGSEIRSSKISTQVDDVLICKINPRINRVWRTRASHRRLSQIASPEWVVLRLPEQFRAQLASYLRWYLSSPEFRSKITTRVSGVTGSHTRAKPTEILEQMIPIPPLSEQGRMIDTLEDYFSRLDAAGSGLHRAKQRAASLHRSMVNQGISGQLSASEESDRPAEELFNEITRVLEVSGARRRKLKGTDLAADPSLYPNHWVVQPLGSLCSLIEYGTSAKTTDNSIDSVPVLRMGNIQGGMIDASNLKFLPKNHSDVGKLLLEDGDLLFNRTNSAELVGKSAVYHSAIGQMTFASYLIRCRLAPGVEPEWVSLFINSPAGRRYIESVASQQVGQANVNGTKLASFPIPLPPHEEQLRIMDAVGEWRITVDHALHAAEQAGRQSVRLRQALMNAAFAGRLVPQDPSEEPASILLERIRADRATLPKSKRGRSSKKASAASTRSAPSISSGAAGTFVQEELGL
jgi:type I restriction enzyme, S subunit